MKKLLKISVLMLAVGLMLGFAGCPGEDKDEDEYAQYFEGTYRNNRIGKTEVLNNSSSDMLLFEGKTLTVNSIVGGVRSVNRATINFSGKSNYITGGWVLLQAVRLEEFKANGQLSRIDHGAMAVYGADREYTVSIEAATDGDLEFEVNNFDPNYALELRVNSPIGSPIAFLTKGERNRVIKISLNPNVNASTITIFSTWVAIDRRTMTPLTVSPAGPFQTRTIAPIAPPGQRPHVNFPIDEAPIFNPEVKFAGINVINNTAWGIRFGIANQPFKAASNRDLINPGARDSFEVEAADVGLNITITVPDGHNVSVPARFADETGFPVLQNGYIYTVGFAQITTTPSTDPADWYAVIVPSGQVDINDHLESP